MSNRQIDLQTLTNPDENSCKSNNELKQQIDPFGWDSDFQEKLLSGLIFNDKFFRSVIDYIKVQYFTAYDANADKAYQDSVNKIRQRFVRQLIDHWKEYGCRIDPVALTNELEIDSNKKAALLAQYDSIKDAYDTTDFNSNYWHKKVIEFCRRKTAKYAYFALQDAFDQGMDATKAMEVAQPILDDFYKIGNKTSGFKFLDVLADDFLDGENLDWLVDSFLPAGHSMIIGGAPKAGKTILMLWLFRCMFYNYRFMGGKVHGPVPVLYLDWENPRNYVSGWTKKFLGQEDTKLWQDNFHYATASVHPSGEGVLPEYLTIPFLDEVIKGREKGTIIVDTVRGAFHACPGNQPNWENSSSEIARLIRPIHAWAHKVGWSVVFLHHLNKTGGLSGSTDLCGAVDLVCLFDRDVEGGDNECKFTMLGRLPAPIARRVMYFENDQFVYEDNPRDDKKLRAKEKLMEFRANAYLLLGAMSKMGKDNFKVSELEDIYLSNDISVHAGRKITAKMFLLGILACEEVGKSKKYSLACADWKTILDTWAEEQNAVDG
jgi:hypothetical protein